MSGTRGGGSGGSNLLPLNNSWTGQNTFAAGTITTSNPLTVTQTWNDAGVTFNPLLINITATASAAASLLMDLQVGGASKASISKAGALTLAAGGSIEFLGRGNLSASADGIWKVTDNAGTGFTRLQLGGTTNGFPAIGRSGTVVQILLADNSNYASLLSGSFLGANVAAYQIGATGVVAWSTGAGDPGTTKDIGLARTSAGLLEVNSGTAGTLRDLRLRSLTTTGGRVRAVRVVTAAGAVTVATTDDIVVINKTSGAATAANLPATPTTGQTFVIKDGKGDAATNNITVTPAAGNIDGAATFVMATNYQAITVVYNGTEWNVA